MKRRDFLNLSLAGLGSSFLIKNGFAQQYFPQPSKHKWAILFGTWCGTARDASFWISEGMGGIAPVFDVRQKPDLSAYEHLVIGTAIRSGKGPALLETYLQENVSKFNKKIRALYIVCGAKGEKPGPEQTKTYVDDYLAKICKVESPLSKVFGGRITQRLLTKEENEGLAAFHKQMNKPYIDYDNLARPECMAFGEEVFKKTIT